MIRNTTHTAQGGVLLYGTINITTEITFLRAHNTAAPGDDIQN